MSGGDNYTPPSAGPGGGNESSCDDLSVVTEISNLSTAMAASLTVGDVLDVDNLLVSGTLAPAILDNGTPIGGMRRNGAQVKACIEKGYQFKAEVISKSGSIVTIRVETR